jgi:hypothetical protein
MTRSPGSLSKRTMTMHEETRMLLHPTNRREQIEGVLRFYLTPAQYTSIGTNPERLRAVAVYIFMDGEAQGYRAMVVRSSLKDLKDHGEIDCDAAPYEMPE